MEIVKEASLYLSPPYSTDTVEASTDINTHIKAAIVYNNGLNDDSGYRSRAYMMT